MEEQLAGLEEERARARREADEQGAEVEALRTQVRAPLHTGMAYGIARAIDKSVPLPSQSTGCVK